VDQARRTRVSRNCASVAQARRGVAPICFTSRLSECESVDRPLTTSQSTASMTPIITAFERSPDRGRGLARDMRVRWALEEVDQPYDVRLVSFREMKKIGRASCRERV